MTTIGFIVTFPCHSWIDFVPSGNVGFCDVFGNVLVTDPSDPDPGTVSFLTLSCSQSLSILLTSVLKSIFIDCLTNLFDLILQHYNMWPCHGVTWPCHGVTVLRPRVTSVTGRVSHCHVCHVQYGSLHIHPLKNLVILDSLNHRFTFCMSSNSISDQFSTHMSKGTRSRSDHV